MNTLSILLHLKCEGSGKGRKKYLYKILTSNISNYKMESVIDTVFISALNLGKPCVQVYDVGTGSLLKSFRGICASKNSLCIVGSSHLICGQKDKPLLQAWEINQNEVMQMRLSVPGRVNVLAVNQSNEKLYAIGMEEKIYLYHMNTGHKFGIINRHYQDVTCLKFTLCGNYLASAGEDGFIYLWNKFRIVESLHKFDNPQIDPHYVLGQHADKVTGLCLSGAGIRGILISSSLDHSAKVFDLATGHLRYSLIVNCALTSCEVNSVGSHVFLGGENGKVWVVNLLPHSFSQNLQVEGKGTACHDSAIHHLALTSAGDALITGSANGEVKVWSVIMSEHKNNLSNPSLALQQTLLVGRGPITNLILKKFDTEVFHMSNLETSVVLSPLLSENSQDIFNAAMSLPIQRREELMNEREIFNLTFELFNKKEKAKSKKKKTLDEESMENGITETDLLARVQKLKKSNENLYDFCIKHVLEEA